MYKDRFLSKIVKRGTVTDPSNATDSCDRSKEFARKSQKSQDRILLTAPFLLV